MSNESIDDGGIGRGLVWWVGVVGRGMVVVVVVGIVIL